MKKIARKLINTTNNETNSQDTCNQRFCVNKPKKP